MRKPGLPSEWTRVLTVHPDGIKTLRAVLSNPETQSTDREVGPMPRRIRRRPDADPKAGVRKYGKAAFADPVNNKYPIDTPGRIKAAWAYIHQPENAAKYSEAEVRTIKIRIRRAAEMRDVALPDPDEFVELMARVRKKKGSRTRKANDE